MSPAVFNSCLVLATTVVVLLGVFHPRFVSSVLWRATVTPLASIIGSGFLVLAPILKHSFGAWGLVVMGLLCAVAYAIGAAIRFNIASYRSHQARSLAVPPIVSRLENLASYVLVVAYVISITYYLNLFGAFSISLTSFHEDVHSRIVTTAAIAFIAAFGWTRGFEGLTWIEEGTVGLKLAIIAGLLAGLTAFAVEQWNAAGALVATSRSLRWESLTVAFGLIVTVQGFETSRDLGEEFDPETRIRTMRFAQWLSTAIYLLYIGLTTFCFSEDQIGNSETAIVATAALVAPALPLMLVAAALAAQLSAAVADTAGCGGLAEELTRRRVDARVTYLVISVLGVALTWTADIYAIIAYASRAFAAYYAIQCAIAAVFAAGLPKGGRLRMAAFGLLALLAVLIVVFGRAAE